MTPSATNQKSKRFQFARYWTVRSVTASLLVVAALLPAISALTINYWLNGSFDWQEISLELGVACLTLALIAYPAFYLLSWESAQANRLDETQQDFKILIDQVVDMVFLVSLEGKIIEANQKAYEFLGYTKGELKDLSIIDLDIDCYLHRHPRLVETMKKGGSVTYETNYRLKNDQRIPVECRARMAGWLEEPHYIEFVSDISRRRKAELEVDRSKEALEQNRNILEMRIAEHSNEIKKQKRSREMAERYANSMQNYLEKLIDSMPSGIIAVDDQYRVMQWNIEAEKMTNIKAKMAIGEKLSKLFPELDVEISRAVASADLLDQNINFQFKTTIHHQLRTLDVVIYPIFNLNQDEQGEVIRIDDVTEKLKINETLVQTEKMLSLGGLAAGMAHEINNPLGAIMQSTQNIQRRLSKDLPRNKTVAEKSGVDLDALEIYLDNQRVNEFLDGVIISGERAANIVGDMLSFARPASQASSEVNLQEAMDTALRLSTKDYSRRKKFDFRQIELRKTYSPDAFYVLAQKSQLQQVFLNLLVNAAQALANVEKENFQPLIEIIIRREGKMACVEVIDNGPGMDGATRKRVFEPFFTTKDEKVGTGLGLSVSYFIVTEQLRGRLLVESQQNKGCRFTMYLPLVVAQANDDVSDDQIELPL